MRCLIASIAVASLAACTPRPPLSAGQRADALRDVAENHPHPPGLVVGNLATTGYPPLRCWDNGQDTVCSR